MQRADTDKLVELAFEFLCGYRVGDLIDAERAIAAVDLVCQPSRTERLLQRFIAPARGRLFERASNSSLMLGVWLTERARQRVADELGKPRPLPRRIVEEVVASKRVRTNVRDMVQELVSGVFERVLKATPGGSGKGLFGVIGVGARVAGAATRGLFGGIADEVIDTGVELVQQRMVERLTSDETARQIGLRRRAAFLSLLETHEPKAGRFLERGPWAIVDELLPELIAHNLARHEVREALRAEIEAFLKELSRQSVGELLDELGLRETVRHGLREHVAPLVEAFSGSARFEEWKKALA
jgi:hypothetical protein